MKKALVAGALLGLSNLVGCAGAQVPVNEPEVYCEPTEADEPDSPAEPAQSRERRSISATGIDLALGREGPHFWLRHDNSLGNDYAWTSLLFYTNDEGEHISIGVHGRPGITYNGPIPIDSVCRNVYACVSNLGENPEVLQRAQEKWIEHCRELRCLEAVEEMYGLRQEVEPITPDIL